MPRKQRFTDEQLIEAVKNSRAISHVLDQLGLRPAGGNYLTIHRKIKQLGLDTSHFHGSGWLRGRRNPFTKKYTLEQIMVKNSWYAETNKLKQRLIAEGYMEHRCMRCGLTEWLGEMIPLELHHKNGDRMDHRLENLQLLCPNCHALTPTYRARNKGRAAPTNGA